jgi:hypothetical protein
MALDVIWEAKGYFDVALDGIAYLRIESCDEIQYAEIEASELAKDSIFEGDAFKIEVTLEEIKLTRIPPVQLTSEEYAELDARLEKAFPRADDSNNW